MDINSYLYTSPYSSTIFGSNSSRGVQFRGGVTGWEQKAGGSSSASSPSNAVNQEVADYLTSVKSFGTTLNSAMASLMGTGKDGKSVFDALGATSSDSNAMSINVTDQTQAKAFFEAGGEKTMEVYQLAEAQQNKGTMLSADATNTMSINGSSFSIEKGGKTYGFNVDINYTDANRTAQQKVADAINAENMGVKATVQYNNTTQKSSLVLTSNETGAANGFSIKDGAGSNLISKMGVGTATTAAQDAEFSVDGFDATSSTNTVDLGDGLKATLKAATEEEATIKAGPNTADVTKTIYDMVNSFNQLREQAVNMSDDSNAQRLQERLDSISSAYSGTLETMGITTNSSGYWDLDKETMNTAISNGTAEKALGNDSSLARSLTSVASQAENDPGRFLSYKARTAQAEDSEAASAADAYAADMSQYNFTPYQAMQLSQWDMVGMLFSAGF